MAGLVQVGAGNAWACAGDVGVGAGSVDASVAAAGALVGIWIAGDVGSTPRGAGICPPHAPSRSNAIKLMDARTPGVTGFCLFIV